MMREVNRLQEWRLQAVKLALPNGLRLARSRRGTSRTRVICAAALSLIVGLTGCAKQPVNPPRLILDGDAEMTIQLFMQATILLSRKYGFVPTISYAELQTRSVRAGFRPVPLAIPDTFRATPDLRTRMVTDSGPALEEYLANSVEIKPLIKYYIRTGLRASQLICRNYLTNLDESNAYLQFIKDEFGVAASLASSALVLAGANGTLKDSFLLARSSVDQGFAAYEEFRFLNVDRQAARHMVEAAQAKLAEHYFKRIDEATPNDSSAAGGYSFSDAIDAVSVIEYQCTREGIRTLLNRTVANTPTNMAVDPATGTIVFKSTGDATLDAIRDQNRPTSGGVINGVGSKGSSKGGVNVILEETDAEKTALLGAYAAGGATNARNLAGFVRLPPLRDLPPVKSAFPMGLNDVTDDAILTVVLKGTKFVDVRRELLALARRSNLIAMRQ
jgi:hypothetical protein